MQVFKYQYHRQPFMYVNVLRGYTKRSKIYIDIFTYFILNSPLPRCLFDPKKEKGMFNQKLFVHALIWVFVKRVPLQSNRKHLKKGRYILPIVVYFDQLLGAKCHLNTFFFLWHLLISFEKKKRKNIIFQ